MLFKKKPKKVNSEKLKIIFETKSEQPNQSSSLMNRVYDKVDISIFWDEADAVIGIKYNGIDVIKAYYYTSCFWNDREYHFYELNDTMIDNINISIDKMYEEIKEINIKQQARKNKEYEDKRKILYDEL